MTPIYCQNNNTVGVLTNNELTVDGYTLFSPNKSSTVYLIDNCGEMVHYWSTPDTINGSLHLYDNGNLLFTAQDKSKPIFRGAGKMGWVKLYDWDNNLLWSHSFVEEYYCFHHDMEPLPNGNVLLILWDRYPLEEVLAKGMYTWRATRLLASHQAFKSKDLSPKGTIEYGTDDNNCNLFVNEDFFICDTCLTKVSTFNNFTPFDDNLKIFPDPAKNTLVVQVSNTNLGNYKIVDSMGKIVVQQDVLTIPCNEIRIDVQKLISGVYFISFINHAKIYRFIIIKF